MLIAREGSFTTTGYLFVMNQDASKRDEWRAKMLGEFQQIDDFLNWQNPGGTFLFDRFGLAETVLTPMFMRFWFLEDYEDFELPESLSRVRRWRDACLTHPATGQPR
jgi:glutathione S-transferase